MRDSRQLARDNIGANDIGWDLWCAKYLLESLPFGGEGYARGPISSVFEFMRQCNLCEDVVFQYRTRQAWDTMRPIRVTFDPILMHLGYFYQTWGKQIICASWGDAGLCTSVALDGWIPVNSSFWAEELDFEHLWLQSPLYERSQGSARCWILQKCQSALKWNNNLCNSRRFRTLHHFGSWGGGSWSDPDHFGMQGISPQPLGGPRAINLTESWSQLILICVL